MESLRPFWITVFGVRKRLDKNGKEKKNKEVGWGFSAKEVEPVGKEHARKH